MNKEFDIEKVCKIINKYKFKSVTLQFPDEISHICVDIYDNVISQLEPMVDVFIAADSTFGSSVDDVSALHVDSELLVYFGSDLSSGGSIPVIISPQKKIIDLQDYFNKLLLKLNSDSTVNLFYLFDPSYSHYMEELMIFTSSKYPKTTINKACLPLSADLDNWLPDSNPRMTNKILVGGLLVDSFILHSLDHLIIYIGDKDEQLVNIYLNLSQHTILSYSPITRVLTTQVGSQSKEFSQRTGGMLKVKDATTIGIIIGSMGLTGKVTQDIVNRVKILIHESGKKHYTFAMGRLNEAKLSNFPEVDIFCLIGNDDNSIIPAKTFHVPVITPWELELGLGGRLWTSTFKSHAGAILEESEGQNSLGSAMERIRINRPEPAEDDLGVEHLIEKISEINQGALTIPSPSVDSTVINRNNDTELVTNQEIGTQYYRDRLFKGLEVEGSVDRKVDTLVHLGNVGLPFNSYRGSMMDHS